MDETLPQGVLIAYYGDDFTGSTDVMEVLTFAGLPTVLFLEAPAAADLERFGGRRGIGIAGTARSRPPDWQRTHLPPMLRTLAGLGAPVVQYKVCSTFDSGPSVGSIGCALDLGWATVDPDWCAMVVAAPALRRYQAFGTLFAAVDGVAHRLDRHPTMARHPVTPMAEADLRRHLAQQTGTAVALIDLVALKHGEGEAALQAARDAGPATVLFDVVDDETLRETGRLIWRQRGRGLLAVASSGLEYALVAHWRAAGLLPQAPTPPARGPAAPILVVSGSCSPVSAGQLGWAMQHGFAPLRLDSAHPSGDVARVVDAACDLLGQGRDVAVFSALGPDDPAVAVHDGSGDHQRAVAGGLGEALAQIVQRAAPPRIVVAGGDTSGEAASRLGIYALEAVMPLDPGAPLCVGHRRHAPEIEIVLKGGQIGRTDFYGLAKAGGGC